ncbi:hypothetical protein [Endozoicomonas sp. SCSIO W0465]|uniref:hypothetical protein n=1 Tax=Endozoicomonas sp. SCSIO W0465 TaxID=2918516 RepID=UPI0020760055|nr:hypothetical protein [Endozoicomonas sp. SCSIO W0465]USE37424.1 hypothetical protein MJO57_04140 [Endozoicomonas sp. SCSIO W0465]
MANTGPVVAPQVTTTHVPFASPHLPGAKPPTVTKARPVAVAPTMKVDQSTQTPPQAPFVPISDRAEEGVTVSGEPKRVRSAENLAEEIPAQPAPAGQPEKKEESIVVLHKRSLSERAVETLKVVGSYLALPLKLIVNIVKLVAKPLQNYVITPAYEGFLYVFQPARYDARKLEQKAIAEKAQLDHSEAKRQAFEKACLDVAMKGFTDIHTQLLCTDLAKQFDVTEQEAYDEIMSQKARAAANRLFNQQLKTGHLELNKESVRRVNQQTNEEYQVIPTRALTLADEKNRAAVVVTEKTPDGQVTEKLLDADNAEVARRLGNDPAYATALNDYNKDLEAYQQKLAAYNQEHAKYQKAKEKADKKDKAFDKQAPVHPGMPPKRPALKCTDQHVIDAYKLQSGQHRYNLHSAAQTLVNDLDVMKADFHAAYPGNWDTTRYIGGARDPEAYKAEVEALVNALEASLAEQRRDLTLAEEIGDRFTIQASRDRARRLEMDIDINRRHLAIYAKECTLMSIHKELEYLNRMCPALQEHRAQDIDDWKNGALVLDSADPHYGYRASGTRDRLDIDRLKNWVYKDAKGDVLDIFARDSSGRVVGVSSTTYAKVNDIVIPTPDKKITPEYNGKTSDSDYQHQQGMKWSKASPSELEYRSYVAQRDEYGKVLKDLDGNVKWQEAPGQLSNHWVVKCSNINGRHEGYDKFRTIVKNQEPVSKPVVSVRIPEAPVGMTRLEKIEQESDQRVAKMSALLKANGEKRHTLTEENLLAYNQQLAAERSKQRFRSASADNVPGQSGNDTSEIDDNIAAMPRQLFQLQKQGSDAGDDSDDSSMMYEIIRDATPGAREFMSDSQFLQQYIAGKAERVRRGVVSVCSSHSDDGFETIDDNPLIEPSTEDFSFIGHPVQS